MKSRITREEKIMWWSGRLFDDDILDLAITKAYKDLMRTIRGFADIENHDEIITNARSNLKSSIIKILSQNITTQKQFDIIHEEACNELIKAFSIQPFTIGQAQKWINMTFKYLYLLEYEKIDSVYEYCHVPIDSYMLNITNYSMSKPWSKLNDYKEYLNYQIWFRNKYNDSIPLDKEFYLWLEEAKKNRT